MSKIIFVIAFLGLSLNAQAQQNKFPLVEVLEYLESKHPFQFNYLFNTIDSVMVSYPPENSTFQEAITFLQQHTEFNFSILNDFVTITEKGTLILCGYLKDIETNVPIGFATVQGKNSSATSDENGYFQLEVKRKNGSVIIHHLGYKELKKNYRLFKKDTCEDILLVSELIKLNQIILSNYLIEGIDKLNNGSFQINFSEFSLLPGLIEADILQTIQALPGIQSIDETVSNINIRGGSNDENLLLWDGIKMYQSGHFFGLISIFNPNMTDNTILTKNGTSAQYSDGVSGTIEMRTNDALNSDFNGSIGLNFLNFDAFTDVPIGKKSSLQISARKGLNGVFKTPTYNSYFDKIKQNSELDTNTDTSYNSNTNFDFYDTSLRWLYQINKKNQIKLNFLTLENELKFNENALINDVNESRQSSLEQISYGAGLFYKRIWTDVFETTFQIYDTDYKIKGVNVNVRQDQQAQQVNEVSETGIKLNTFYKINNSLSFLNGYQFIETQVTNFDNVDNPVYNVFVAEVLRTHSVYSELKFLSKNKSTTVTPGLRINYIPRFDKYIFEPRLSFNKAFNQYLNLELLGEFKHQVTSQIINLQGDFLGVDERRWQLSNNSNIPVIRSKQISLGLQYNHNGWLIHGEGYLKKVKGITSQSQGFQNQFLLSRTSGNSQVYGFDFLLRKQFKNINTWLSYAYMDNYYEFETLHNDKFHNNFDTTNTITFGTLYNLGNFKFSTGFNWHTGKPTTMPVLGNEVINGNINYEQANSKRLQDYFRVDLSTTYEFNLTKHSKAKVGASIWNLLNQTNTLNTHYRLDSNDSIEQISQNSLGFTPNFSFRVMF